jgi:Tfp pilus assembly protein PilV
MGGTAGHSLVEVIVATLIVTAALLPAGHAVASAIRLGRKGEAAARVALALMARASLVQQSAGATAPRCLSLTAGSAVSATLVEWWTVRDTGALRRVQLHARVPGAGWPVEDSVELRVRCR